MRSNSKRLIAACLLAAAWAALVSGPGPERGAPWGVAGTESRTSGSGGAEPPSCGAQADDHACRFWGIVACAPEDSLMYDHLVGGEHSLMTLSDGNPDGWSVAYHSPSLAAAGLSRSQILRGWPRADHATDGRYREAVAEMVSMGALCGLAHIRDASPGTHTGVPDPHFFRREGVTFGHNGGLSETKLVTLLEAGSPGYLETHPPDYEDPCLDSELLFLYILRIRQEGPPGSRLGAVSLKTAVAEAVLSAYEADAIETAANCIATDGDSILAVRFDVNDEKKYRVRFREAATGWVVASEPVGSDTAGWSALPPKSIGVFRADRPPAVSTIYPPPWPDLVLAGQLVDDDLTGDSSGNADGGCDSGELVELVVSLRNEGSVTAGSVVATLSTADEYCSVIDDTEEYGDIDPGAEAVCPDDFDVLIDPGCPNGHIAVMSLNVVSAERGAWNLEMLIDIDAPDIRLYDYTVDDSEDGNGDGHVDPGESFDLTPVFLNAGSEAATSLECELSIAHPAASMLSGEAELDSLPAGGKGSPSPAFSAGVDEDIGAPEALLSAVGIDADWGQSEFLEFLIPVGGFWDEMEAGPGAWTSYIVTPGFQNQWHMSSQRNYTAGGLTSWKCGSAGGDYAHLLDAALEAEPIQLQERSYLRFRHWMNAEESGSQPGRCYDGGMVELSVNGGAWTQITPVGGYTHTTLEGSVQGPWPAGTEVYSGDIDWEEALFEIAGDTGTARLRFRFGSDGAYAGEGWYIDDVEVFGTDALPTGAPEPTDPTQGTSLELLAPNPFGVPSPISYRLPATAEVTIDIYDVAGRLVRSFNEGRRPAGRHALDWDGRDVGGGVVASGVYFVRLAAGSETVSRKLVVLR